MSSNLSIIYGYGFNINDVTAERLLKFIKNHRGTVTDREFPQLVGNMDNSEVEKEIAECAKDCYNYDETNERLKDLACTCQISGFEGAGAIISNIMTHETGIKFEYQPSENTEKDNLPSIIFAEGYPWQMHGKEKELTKESLKKCMAKYAGELEINPKEIDFKRILYNG